MLIIYFQVLVPRSLVVIIYLLAAIFVVLTRLKYNERSKSQFGGGHSASDLARLRRSRSNIKLVFKFLALSLLLIFSDLAIILPSLTNSLIHTSIPIKLVVYLSTIVYFFQPLFIIFVHNQLKKTLYGLISRLFNNLFSPNRSKN